MSLAVNTQVMDTLEVFAKKAADELRVCISSAELDNYKHFLDVMYHYTSGSETMLKDAANCSENSEIKEFLNHMAKEERGHYIIAREDLKALGHDVSETPPGVVYEFRKNWQELSKKGVFGYLGAIYVFENVAKYLQKEGREMLQRLNLTKVQSRWIAVHLEADLEHGEEIKEICDKFQHENPEEMQRGANIMYASWVNVFEHAFSKTLETNNVRLSNVG